MRTRLIIGDINAWCPVCGFNKKGSELQKRWDGILVCSDCNEPRHPQDLARIPRVEQPPKIVQPEPADVEIEVDWVAEDVGVQDNEV